jgi:DNA-directed RNA polymerase specialized sigma24 family protein
LLSDGQRTVMALVIDGFEPTEIAERLGKTPEAVRQSLRAARTRLQHHLQEQQASQGAERPASSSTKEARR